MHTAKAGRCGGAIPRIFFIISFLQVPNPDFSHDSNTVYIGFIEITLETRLCFGYNVIVFRENAGSDT